MSSYITSYRVPGASFVAIKDGKVVKRGDYGFANLEFGVHTAKDTLYPLASATKLISAIAVLMLADAEKLALDESIDRYLPSLPKDWRVITIRQLLTHSSGLPDILVSATRDFAFRFRTQEELFENAAKMPPVSKPGGVSTYNQTDYALLGSIVEKVSGTSFVNFVAQHIIQPFHMTSTVYGDTVRFVARRATLYASIDFQSDRTVKELKELEIGLLIRDPEYTFPCVGLNSTADDLAKLVVALDTGKLLKPKTLEQMWERSEAERTAGAGYGCAWYVSGNGRSRIATCDGGASVLIRRELESRLTIILLTNCQGARPEAIVPAIAELCRSQDDLR
ncbi:MAG: serine hydrolase domain-containing protein [Isosphaeraceae bacterium]